MRSLIHTAFLVFTSLSNLNSCVFIISICIWFLSILLLVYALKQSHSVLCRSLNSNNFIGGIPATVGYLTELYWLDLADNKLTGTIPVSNGSSPGLDLLVHTKHLYASPFSWYCFCLSTAFSKILHFFSHFGKNQLSGEIPAGLFHSNLSLIHL